ncbi:hypothetical protein HPP92_019787 [Vanilla planifolia]|uniref:Class IV aminotransferase n=1 Tax=Vanilla planifolia TaxID=51239 RepID=A0A835UJH6_VANPL|nr:hypothetical protein HPP92_019787 [Vanilla planifolia]
MGFGAASRFLVVNGAPRVGDIPSVSTLLESIPGAYTTTRTHEKASCLLFWERHLRRLIDSTRILADRRPDFLGPVARADFSAIKPLVFESLQVGLGLALTERGRLVEEEEDVELAVTTLVSGGGGRSGALDVFLHIGFYVPPVFGAGGARLAVAGRGRDVAQAKYSQWARIRKDLEKMRPPLVTELLLSNDGDRILEGSVTNFFVVRTVDNDETDNSSCFQDKANCFEVQTAPLSDGVLPGIVRQLVIEVCSNMGFPLKEIAPSWSDHEFWEEAFITNGLRLLQHVELVQAPTACIDFHLKSWNEVSWTVKKFEGVGTVTTLIQREILRRIEGEAYQISNFL